MELFSIRIQRTFQLVSTVIGKIGLIFMFGLYTLRISEERYLKVDSFI